MNHWIALFAVSRETVRKQGSSRRFVKESTMKSLASDARKSLRLLAKESSNKNL